MTGDALLGPGFANSALGMLLVLARVSVAVMLLPGVGEADAPPMLRAGFAIALTILVAPAQFGAAPSATEPVACLVLQLLHEVLCGLLLGFTARLVALALPIAAELITLFVGLTSVVQPDPELGPSSSALARLFSLAVPVMLLASGLYALPIRAVADSYRLVPLGGALPSGDLVSFVTVTVRRSFDCAFRLAAPFIVVSTLWQVCVGVLARFVPTLQAGVIAAPGQLLGGLILLAALTGVLLPSWIDEATSMFDAIGSVIHG